MSEAWEQATRAAGQAGVEILPLTSLGEADRAVEVMKSTWGEDQLIPRELLRAFQASESVFQGAYRGDDLVGFVLGFYGRDADGFHLHSHMLAVMPDVRSQGVGYALKLAQRAATLDAGVTRARWTFDSLQARNARFNLSKLRAVADGFHRDFYGEMGDLLNEGDRTDRLVVRWDLLGAGAPELRGPVPTQPPLRPPAPAEGFEVLGREGPDAAPMPTEVRVPSGGPALVRIPRDHPDLRRRDPALGQAWREASARAFEVCFEAGLAATGFGDATYVFT